MLNDLTKKQWKPFESKRKTMESIEDKGLSRKDGLPINAPLGGNIFKVEFSVGDKVTEDDAVIILEAMKMETAIKPPKPGIISNINVSQGDKVNPGDPLFEIV